MINSKDENITLMFDNARLTINACGVVLITKLIEGKYPNYEAVIPKNNNKKLTLDRLELLQKIKNISIYANQSTNQIRLSIKPNSLNLTAEDLDYSTKATVDINCLFENPEDAEFEIGFNSKFLQEMLSNLETNNIQFVLLSPGSAALIYEEENDDMFMLLMPVMLNK